MPTVLRAQSTHAVDGVGAESACFAHAAAAGATSRGRPSPPSEASAFREDSLLPPSPACSVLCRLLPWMHTCLSARITSGRWTAHRDRDRSNACEMARWSRRWRLRSLGQSHAFGGLGPVLALQQSAIRAQVALSSHSRYSPTCAPPLAAAPSTSLLGFWPTQ